ncbi:hypothetical protein AAC387_Pa02g4590 [Persea americana]
MLHKEERFVCIHLQREKTSGSFWISHHCDRGSGESCCRHRDPDLLWQEKKKKDDRELFRLVADNWNISQIPDSSIPPSPETKQTATFVLQISSDKQWRFRTGALSSGVLLQSDQTENQSLFCDGPLHRDCQATPTSICTSGSLEISPIFPSVASHNLPREVEKRRPNGVLRDDRG